VCRWAKSDRKTFFADGWIFGATLAVDVRGVTDGRRHRRDGADCGAAAATEQADATLKERIDAAALGVVGTVTNVERSTVETTHISEHDPELARGDHRCRRGVQREERAPSR